MKKFSVHVILPQLNKNGSSFHSVLLECDGYFVSDKGYYAFYIGTKENVVSCYPIQYTIIEPYNPTQSPIGASGAHNFV